MTLFNFTPLPHHEFNKNELKTTYIFSLQEVMRAHTGVFWMDASVRFISNNITDAMTVARRSRGITLFLNTGHSIFAATHQETYNYLHISRQTSINTQMYGGGVILIYRTHYIYHHILFWWILCSLNEKCIAPVIKFQCYFEGKDKYGNCHRYDQSAINIILANHYKKSYFYLGQQNGLLVINREPTTLYKIQK